MIGWTISPYSGVGPLRFGMNPPEVAQLIGSPTSTRKDWEGLEDHPELQEKLRGRTTEFRDSGAGAGVFPTYQDEKLVLVGFDKAVQSLNLNGYFLFKHKRSDVIATLTAIEENVFEDFDGYIFLDSGIMMGFPVDFRSDPSIGVFAKNLEDAGIRESMAEELGEFVKGGL